MIDYEVDDEFSCPKCDHSPIHWRRCNQCDEAFIDKDVICELCLTTGVESWCPSCGANIQYSLLVESDPCMTKDDLDFMFCYWLPWESEILEPIYQQARDMAQAIVDNTACIKASWRSPPGKLHAPGKERSAALMNLLLSVKHTTKAILKERAIAHE